MGNLKKSFLVATVLLLASFGISMASELKVELLGVSVSTNEDRSKGPLVIGARIVSVTPNSPASRANIMPGDVITAIGNQHVGKAEDVARAMENRKAGEVRVALSDGGRISWGKTVILVSEK